MALPDQARRPARPTAAQIAAAHGQTIPDLVAPGPRVLFAGINPSLYSAAVGYHFARPGNRFWPAMHQSGFTGRQLAPPEQHILLDLGFGITNVVARATARADELDAAELRAGWEHLAVLAARVRPAWLAVLGVTAYRAASGRKAAAIGPQADRLAGAQVWVLPNPSGLNASWATPRLVAAFRELRETADQRRRDAPGTDVAVADHVAQSAGPDDNHLDRMPRPG